MDEKEYNRLAESKKPKIIGKKKPIINDPNMDTKVFVKAVMTRISKKIS